jgi:ABC-type proline/glycine betaine transport system ATPase subunit
VGEKLRQPRSSFIQVAMDKPERPECSNQIESGFRRAGRRLTPRQRQLRKTILFVTHDVEEALRLADKIIIMRTGTIVQYDTPLKIITQPRDTFVRDLTGADDVLRRLSLLSVRDALAAGRNGNGVAASDSEPHSETIRLDDNLRDALARLLRLGIEALPVAGRNGEQLGQLSLDELRRIAQDKEIRRQGDKERVF